MACRLSGFKSFNEHWLDLPYKGQNSFPKCFVNISLVTKLPRVSLNAVRFLDHRSYVVAFHMVFTLLNNILHTCTPPPPLPTPQIFFFNSSFINGFPHFHARPILLHNEIHGTLYTHHNVSQGISLKWYYDQKIISFFSPDFESVFA